MSIYTKYVIPIVHYTRIKAIFHGTRVLTYKHRLCALVNQISFVRLFETIGIISWLDNHPTIKQWIWFVILWAGGLLSVMMITYPIKWLMKNFT